MLVRRVRLAVQDAALSRRKSWVQIPYAVPKIYSINEKPAGYRGEYIYIKWDLNAGGAGVPFGPAPRRACAPSACSARTRRQIPYAVPS